MFQYFSLNFTFEKTLKSSNFLLMDLQQKIFSNFKKNYAFLFTFLKKENLKKGGIQNNITN